MRKTRRRIAVQEDVARPAVVVEPDGLWSIAMLRIAMELKRPDAPSLERVVERVVERMGIPQDQFERYLSEHLGLLTRKGS